jgi:DNA-binding SARP family transcriptional activator
MENNAALQITMLGNCALTCGDCTVSDDTIRSKKFWIALEYLILNRDREIPQAELTGVLYTERESDNPANALKTLIHRIRSTLDALQFIDSRRIILNVRGAYKWNSDLSCCVDIDVFESLCEKASSPALAEDERLSAALDALALYRGDFLPKLKNERWAQPLQYKFRTLYESVLHGAVDLLEKQGDFERIVSLCRHAAQITPYDEYPYYGMIHALAMLGDGEEAMKEYSKMSHLFYRQLGVSPSTDLRRLYREIVKSVKTIETDLSVIQEDLGEQVLPDGAFFCEYEMFKDIYRLEVRSSARVGAPIHLCLLTLETQPGAEPSLKSLNHYMEKLQDCVNLSLRRGDVYAKYSISQFIFLLPAGTYESAVAVMTRIAKRFHRENARAPFDAEHTVRAIDLLL